MHKNFSCLSASFFTAIPYILKHICVVACMRWYYSLMPSYRFNCMCLQFYFSEFSSCYFFLTSASYGSLLLLFLYVFVFYDDFGIIFFRGNFFFETLEKLIFAQARRFNGFLFTSSFSSSTMSSSYSFVWRFPLSQNMDKSKDDDDDDASNIIFLRILFVCGVTLRETHYYALPLKSDCRIYTVDSTQRDKTF